MQLYPAIDIRDGRCVRLLRGDYGQETVYGEDPVAVAQELVAAGATWLHVVDLDAARTGLPANRALVTAIAALAQVQAGGGVRDDVAAEALFDAGVARVVVGTAAMESDGPVLVARLARSHPGGIAVGLDARQGDVAVRGWTAASGVSVATALNRFVDMDVAAFVVTDIERDGLMSGPDLFGLSAALEASSVPIIASGGVGALADLSALAALRTSRGRRLEGAIVGKALYEGRFTLAEAASAVVVALTEREA